MKSMTRILAIASTVLLWGACAQNCAADHVATEVSRLTIHNLAAIINAAEANQQCGFKSPSVLANSSSQGELGDLGSVTWKANNCRIDFGDETLLAEDCLGNRITARGAVTLTGTKTLSGLRSGLQEAPIIPAGPDALRYELSQLVFENFSLSESGDENSLEIRSGQLTASITQRLAVDDDSASCTVPTPNMTFAQVRYDNAVVLLHEADNQTQVPVSSADLQAQMGLGASDENSLQGNIVIWGESHLVPDPEAAAGLDPNYQAEAFVQTYACQPNIAQPVSFTCSDLRPQVVDASARLTADLVNALAQALYDDSQCGLSAPSVRAGVITNAATGEAGDATWQVQNCTLNFLQPQLVSRDCLGRETFLSGQVSLNATQIVHGLITGDVNAPVIPDSDDAEQLSLLANFTNLGLSRSDSDDSLTLSSGTLSATLWPQLALSSRAVCDLHSANLRLSDVKYDEAHLLLQRAQGSFGLSVNSAEMQMLAGTWGAESNELSGVMQVEGQDIAVNSDGAGLDPQFQEAEFNQRWQCLDDLRSNPSQDCSPRRKLAQDGARLGGSLFSTLASLVKNDSQCGFAAPAVIAGVVRSDQSPGAKGYGLFHVQDCIFDFSSPTVVHTDCDGNQTILHGRAIISGDLRIDGWLTGDPDQPVIPDQDLAITLDLNVQGQDLRQSTSGNDAAITLRSGQISGTLKPRLARSTQRICELPSPHQQISAMQFLDASLLLEGQGQTLACAITDSQIDVTVGEVDRLSNALTGWVEMDGDAIQVPFDGAGFDPSYNASAFDARWQCLDAIQQPIDFLQCSYNVPLGEHAARLLVQALWAANQALDDDTACGFSANSVLTSATTSSDNKSVTWSTVNSPCAIDFVDDTVLTTDCSGSSLHVRGGFTAATKKTIVGELTAGPDRIWPTTRDAQLFHYASLQFRDWQVFRQDPDSSADPDSVVLNGSLSVDLTPVGGESLSNSTTSGDAVYNVRTPVFSVENLSMSAGQALLVVDGQSFFLDLAQAQLNAYNGRYEGQGNSLSGSLRVNSEAVSLGTDLPLDTNYQQSDFNARYVCTPDLVEPVPAL